MNRPFVWFLGLVAAGVALPGCRIEFPEVKPGDPELQRYQAAATSIEYPDSQTPARPELTCEPSPLSIGRDAPPEYWDLSLTEVLRLALMHSKVLSDVGGLVLQSPANVRTIQQPAIVETDPRFGVDATLSAFDPVFSTSATFVGNHQAINNVFFGGGTRILEQNTAVMQTSLSKRTAFGGTISLTENTDFDANNAPGNLYPQAYNTNWEMSVRQSWLQGGGAQFNRIYGPPNVPGVFSGVPGFANGVLVARINTDISLTEFEMGVRDLVSNVENAYWDLYFAYRDLDAKIMARDSALETWRRIHALFLTGRRGGEAEKEAEAREQYFRFQEEVQIAWFGRLVDGTRTANGSGGGTLRGVGGVRVAERRLRMLAGLPINECKLIRPSDEPRQAKIVFEWDAMLREAVARRAELRRQKWVIKRRELELLASKNFLLPTLDTTALYRVQGFGENLLNGTNDPTTGTYQNAVANLYSGQFGYWQAGANFSVPLGLRRGHAAVRNAELQLTREKAVLEQQEREVVHSLSNAIAEAERAYESVMSSYNRRGAARQHLEAVRAAFEADKAEPELMFDSQRRLAESDIRYFGALVEYSLAIKNVHFEKGSLLDYNDIHLAEGEWPGKAYVDAAEREDRRFKNRAMNYAFTRPPIQVSAGQYPQATSPTQSLVPSAQLPLLPQKPLTPGAGSTAPAEKPADKAAPETVPADKPDGKTTRPPSLFPAESNGLVSWPINGPPVSSPPVAGPPVVGPALPAGLPASFAPVSGNPATAAPAVFFQPQSQIQQPPAQPALVPQTPALPRPLPLAPLPSPQAPPASAGGTPAPLLLLPTGQPGATSPGTLPGQFGPTPSR